MSRQARWMSSCKSRCFVRWSRVQRDLGAGVILIGHDMALMAQFAHVVGVMYAGSLVEDRTDRAIFNDPRHPIPRLLIRESAELRTAPGASGASPACRPRWSTLHPAARSIRVVRARRFAARTKFRWNARCPMAGGCAATSPRSRLDGSPERMMSR